MQVQSPRAGRKITLLLIALAAALLTAAWTPSIAGAARSLRYSQMRLSIWPEYDDPRVLVILEPVLARSVKLPTKVSFLVPRGASVSMACEITAQGGHACRPKEITRRGQYDQVSYTVLSRRTLYFEYYYDPGFAGPAKEFAFKFVPSAPIDSLGVEIQQPLRSTGFQTTPPPSATASDQQGFTYFQYAIGSAPAGKPVPFAVSYTKPDVNPSVRKQATSPASARSASTVGETGSLPSVLGLLGVAGRLGTIAYGVLAMGRARTQEGTSASSQRSGTDAAVRASPATPVEDAAGSAHGGPRSEILCSECGSELRDRDRFCPTCGASQELACAQCGARCDRESRFCPECGSELAISK